MPVFESTRKVQVFGSSLALTLPSMFVKANEIEKGAEVGIYYGFEGVLVVSMVDDTKALLQSLMAIIDKLEENIAKKNNQTNNHN